MSDGPRSKTHRCRPNGSGERSISRPTQPVTEIVVKTPQPIEVDSVLINPDDLHDFFLASGLLACKEALVHEREPIICRRITVRY